MAHPAGERLRCEQCGAEIVFTKACPCPEGEPKHHYDVCCGKAMRVVGAEVRPHAASERKKAT
jgi:hypothetical protein